MFFSLIQQIPSTTCNAMQEWGYNGLRGIFLKKQYTYICIYCGDKFNSTAELKGNKSFYCGYCYSVKHGKPDRKWLPSLNQDDIDAKGFHKI